MQTRSINTYSFDELSASAKENAIQWFRNTDDGDFWSRSVYEDAADIAEIIGIDLRQTRKTRIDKTTFYAPTIYYSGFSSQGDGACFEGTYKYKKGSLKAIQSYAPNDATLHRIARDLQNLQKRYFYKLQCRMKHRGHYYHEYCMNVDVSADTFADISEAERELTELMRDFAKWIYWQLETEYDYQNSDETVSENIRANEYEFSENGVIA